MLVQLGAARAKSFGSTWFAKNFKPFPADKENRRVEPVIVSYKQIK